MVDRVETVPLSGYDRVTPRPRRLGRMSKALLHFIRAKPLGALGGGFVVLMIVLAIFADVIAPYDYNKRNLRERLEPPSFKHIMGTDNLGRDVFTRIVYGARVSITVGFGGIGLGVLLASMVGITSGYFGGWFDILFQRLVDAWQAFPWLVILLSLIAVLQPGMLTLIFAIGILSASGSSRIIRSATLAVKENQYIEAARAVGGSHARIIIRYILPNVFTVIIIIATIGLGGVILAESALSFLGFGVPPPFPSWGEMLSGSARVYMYRAPWLAIWPGVAISVAVFGFNMLGDALRDVLDPRLRGS
jgi:peptide/nickel transport system permease protein